jgi:hypothetical protein
MSNIESAGPYPALSRCSKASNRLVLSSNVRLVGMLLLATIARPEKSLACEDHARATHAQAPSASAAQAVVVHTPLPSLGKIVTTATVVPREQLPNATSGRPKSN